VKDLPAVTALLSLLLVASPVEPVNDAVAPRAGDVIRARAWKVTLTGGLITAAGLGFLVAGRIIEGMNSTDSAVANTGRAFTVGGVMLACSGVLVGLLSIPMWTWVDERGTEVIALGALGARLRW